MVHSQRQPDSLPVREQGGGKCYTSKKSQDAADVIISACVHTLFHAACAQTYYMYMGVVPYLQILFNQEKERRV